MMQNNPMMGSMMGQQNPAMNFMMPNNGGLDMSSGFGQGAQIDPTAGMSIYKPTGSGTLLSDLAKGDASTNQSNINKNQFRSPIHNMQNMQGYGTYGGIGIDHYDSRINGISGDMDQNYQYVKKGKKGGSSHYSESASSDSESEYSSIRQLANEVNNSLQALEKMENTKKRRKSTDSSIATDSDNEDNDNNENNEHDENFNSEQKTHLAECESDTDYLKLVTEFLLLLTLYVIMSQPFVVSFASSYIHQLNPNEDGTVNMTGIIIYGMIMIVLFLIVRKIVFSRM